MKKVIVYFFVFCFTLLACACRETTSAIQQSADEIFIKPTQEEHSESEQAIVDEVYIRMSNQYPEFSTIPKDMLKTSYYAFNNDVTYWEVSFTFYLGGLQTDVNYSYGTSPRYPEGNFTHDSSAFEKYFEKGFSEEQMEGFKKDLAEQIQKEIDEYKLKQTDNLEDAMCLYWQEIDGGIFLCAEHIADVTDKTTKTFGCGDHAHLFGRVTVFE